MADAIRSMREVAASLEGTGDRDTAERAVGVVRRETENLRRLRGELAALGPPSAAERDRAKRHSEAVDTAYRGVLVAAQPGPSHPDVAPRLLAATDDYARAMVDFTQQRNAVLGEGSPKGNPALVGKWQQVNGGTSEFLRDGTMIISSPKGLRQLKYRFVDDKTIELSTPEGVPVTQWRILSHNAEEIVMINLQGTQSTFRRAK
jgi:hypothetical protein